MSAEPTGDGLLKFFGGRLGEDHGQLDESSIVALSKEIHGSEGWERNIIEVNSPSLYSIPLPSSEVFEYEGIRNVEFSLND